MPQAVTFGRRGVAAPAPARPTPTQPAPSGGASALTSPGWLDLARPSPKTGRTARVAASEERTVLGYFLWMLFSFNGRLKRGTYRLARIFVNLCCLIGVAAFRTQVKAALEDPSSAMLLATGLLALSGLMAWTTLAMQVKRRHDLDRSWPWLFVGFIPIFGPIWVFIETCWLDGTPGNNRFDEAR